MRGSSAGPRPPVNIPAAIADDAPWGCLVDEGLTDDDDGDFVGQYRLRAECGDVGASIVVLAANANSGAGAVVIGVQINTKALTNEAVREHDAQDPAPEVFDVGHACSIHQDSGSRVDPEVIR